MKSNEELPIDETAEPTIEVSFVHPRTERTLIADVSPQFTGEEALRELVADQEEGAYLTPLKPGHSYSLSIRRTQQEILPSMSFEQAGVVNGDRIDIFENATGAGPDWSQLGQMLFWSAAAASIFLKSAAPLIVEFLKSRSSRSIVIERGENKIIVTGHNIEDVSRIWKLVEHDGVAEQRDRLHPPIKVTLCDE